jgi:hypothetical protein
LRLVLAFDRGLGHHGGRWESEKGASMRINRQACLAGVLAVCTFGVGACSKDTTDTAGPAAATPTSTPRATTTTSVPNPRYSTGAFGLLPVPEGGVPTATATATATTTVRPTDGGSFSSPPPLKK